jgi:hypothetical protein
MLFPLWHGSAIPMLYGRYSNHAVMSLPFRTCTPQIGWAVVRFAAFTPLQMPAPILPHARSPAAISNDAKVPATNPHTKQLRGTGTHTPHGGPGDEM